MKIYKLTHDSDGFKTINLRNSKLLNAIIDGFYNDGKPYGIDFGKYKWIESNEIICDFPFISGAIPVVSKNICRALEEYIDKSNIELLPIKVEEEDFYIFHFLNAYKNILNTKLSKIEYFNNGTIKNIKEYVFLSKVKDLAPIFILEDFDMYTFVNEEVANVFSNYEGSGIQLEECRIDAIL